MISGSAEIRPAAPVVDGYEIGAGLASGPRGAVWCAHKKGGPKGVAGYAVRTCVEAPLFEPRGTRPGARVEGFFGSMARQRRIAKGAGGAAKLGSVAPVHAIGATVRGGYAVLDRHALDARFLVRMRVRLPGFLLYRIVGGVIEALEQIAEIEHGRPHGDLRPEAVQIDPGKAPEYWRIALTGLAPPEAVDADGDAARLADMRGLGMLIVELVEHAPFRTLGGYPVRDDGQWSGLGRNAEGWLALANKLLNPDASTATLRLPDIAADVAALREKPPKTKELVLAGSGGGMAAAAGLATLGFLMLREPPIPFNDEAFQFWCEAYDNWYADVAKASVGDGGEGWRVPAHIAAAFEETMDVDRAIGEGDYDPAEAVRSASRGGFSLPDDRPRAAILDEARADFEGRSPAYLNDADLRMRLDWNIQLIGGRFETVEGKDEPRFVREGRGVLQRAVEPANWPERRALEEDLAPAFARAGWEAQAEELRRVARRVSLEIGDERREIEEIDSVMAAHAAARSIQQLWAEVRDGAGEIRAAGQARPAASDPVDPVLVRITGIVERHVSSAAQASPFPDGDGPAFAGFGALEAALGEASGVLADIRAVLESEAWDALDRAFLLEQVAELDAIARNARTPQLSDAREWVELVSSGDYAAPDPALDPRRSEAWDAAVAAAGQSRAELEAMAANQPRVLARERGRFEARYDVAFDRAIEDQLAAIDHLELLPWRHRTSEAIARRVEALADDASTLRATVADLAERVRLTWDELTRQLSNEPPPAELEPLNEAWRSRVEVLIAENAPAGDGAGGDAAREVQDATDAARSLLQRVDAALTALRPPDPQRVPSTFTVEPLRAEHEGRVRRAAESVAAALAEAGYAEEVVRSALNARLEEERRWAEAMVALSGGLGLLETLFDRGYALREVEAEEGDSIASLLDRWGPELDGISDRVRLAFGGVVSRVERVEEILGINDPGALIQAVRGAEHIEAGRLAYERVVRDGVDPLWPGTPDELRRDVEAREAVAGLAGAVDVPPRVSAIRAALEEAGRRRWRGAMDRVESGGDVAGVMALLGRSGLQIGDLDGVARWNAELHLLADRIEVENENDDVVRGQVRAALDRVEEIPGELDPEVARDVEDWVTTFRFLSERPEEEIEPFDPAGHGPGRAGWEVRAITVGEDGFGMLRYTSPGDAAMEFVRTPRDFMGWEEDLFVARHEVSIRLFNEMIGGDAQRLARALRAEPPELRWEQVEIDDDLHPASNAGPRAWSIVEDRFVPREQWLQGPQLLGRQVYPDGLPTPEAPSAQSPMNFVSPSAAAWAAGQIHCELPTLEQWLATSRYHGQEAFEPRSYNLRDASWRAMLAWARGGFQDQLDEGAVNNLTDVHLQSYARPAGALGAVNDAEAVHPFDDGVLFFASVEGAAAGRAGRDRRAAPVHMGGNVHECVVEPGVSASFIGGSALSDPRIPLDEPIRNRARPARATGFADTGFRPVFSAIVKETLGERVKNQLLARRPYIIQ